MSALTGDLGALRRVADGFRRGRSSNLEPSELLQILPSANHAVVAPLLLELVAEGFELPQIEPFIACCEWIGESGARGSETEIAPGHPAETFRSENRALELRIRRIRAALGQNLVPGEPRAVEGVCGTLRELSAVDAHYRRQEFLLFTRLEQRGLIQPGRILWRIHDETRQWLKYLDLQLASGDLDAGRLAGLTDSLIEPLMKDLEKTIYLEENILLPLAREILNEEDWGIIWHHSPKIGWCLVEPRQGYQPPVCSKPAGNRWGGGKLPLATGGLDLGDLVRIHAELPVDVTVVDAEDRVTYFTEGARPVFYRSEAILGRDVHCCHPPRSVHYIRQILSDFKAGRENSAQFWKWIGDRFIHIRFVALRDPSGRYRGTLEVAQDITPLRALKGERLELVYDRRV